MIFKNLLFFSFVALTFRYGGTVTQEAINLFFEPTPIDQLGEKPKRLLDLAEGEWGSSYPDNYFDEPKKVYYCDLSDFQSFPGHIFVLPEGVATYVFDNLEYAALRSGPEEILGPNPNDGSRFSAAMYEMEKIMHLYQNGNDIVMLSPDQNGDMVTVRGNPDSLVPLSETGASPPVIILADHLNDFNIINGIPD